MQLVLLPRPLTCAVMLCSSLMVWYVGGVPAPAPTVAAPAACCPVLHPPPLPPLLPDSRSFLPMLSRAVMAPPPLLSLPLLLSAPPLLLPAATDPPSELPSAAGPVPLLLPEDQRLPPPLRMAPAFELPLSDPAAVPGPELRPSEESLLLRTEESCTPSEPDALAAMPAAVRRTGADNDPAAFQLTCVMRCSEPSGLMPDGLCCGETSLVYGL